MIGILFFNLISSIKRNILQSKCTMKQQDSLSNPSSRQYQRKWLNESMGKIQNDVAKDADRLIAKSHSMQSSKLAVISEHQNKKQCRQPRFSQLKIQEKGMRQGLRSILILEKKAKKQKIQQQKAKNISEPQDNTKIKELTIKYRKFKKSLDKKTKSIEKQEEMYKADKKKLQEEHKKTQCQERRKKISQNLVLMDKKRQQRIENHKKQQQELKKLQKEKLYEKMALNFDQKMEQINQQKRQRFEKLKNLRKVNMDELSEHERRYEEQKAQKEQLRSVKLAESRFFPSINPYKSKFYEKIIQDEEQLKNLRQQKIQRAKQIMRKHKQYKDKVKQEHIPRQKPKQQKIQMKKRKIMERHQQLQIGNKFLKDGQTHAKSLACLKDQTKQNGSKVEPKKVYQNYLPQILKNVDVNKYRGEEAQMRQIRKIINGQGDKRQKIQEINIYTEKYEKYLDPKMSDSEKAIHRLKLKMQVLSMMA